MTYTRDDLIEIEIKAFRKHDPSVRRHILFAAAMMVWSLYYTWDVPDRIFWIIRVGLAVILVMSGAVYWSRVRAERAANKWERERAERLIREFRESHPAITRAMEELGE